MTNGVPLSPASGFPGASENSGDLSNKGVEIQLGRASGQPWAEMAESSEPLEALLGSPGKLAGAVGSGTFAIAMSAALLVSLGVVLAGARR